MLQSIMKLIGVIAGLMVAMESQHSSGAEKRAAVIKGVAAGVSDMAAVLPAWAIAIGGNASFVGIVIDLLVTGWNALEGHDWGKAAAPASAQPG